MGKQIEKLIEEYGIETITELLDLFEITGEEPVAWRNFALKYKIVKKTTKTIRPRIRSKYITTKYSWGEDGVWAHRDVEPHYLYYVTLENGRGQYVFQAKFTKLDIEKWREQYS